MPYAKTISQKKIREEVERIKNSTGNYRNYLKNLYNYYLETASCTFHKDWCYAPLDEMIAATYDGFELDEMAREQTIIYQRTLKQLGYIDYYTKEKGDRHWRVDILKPLDF